MYRPYPGDYPPFEQPRQPEAYPYAAAHPYAQPPMGPAAFGANPPPYGYPAPPPAYAPPYGYAQPGVAQAQPYPQPAPQAYWPPHPGVAYPPPWPQPQAAPQPFYHPEPASRAPQPAAAPEPSPIEEIRASLRECRDAIRELAEQRSQRRYF